MRRAASRRARRAPSSPADAARPAAPRRGARTSPSGRYEFIRKPTLPRCMPKIGTPLPTKRCSVSSMKPSPPSGTMTSASSGSTRAVAPAQLARAPAAPPRRRRRRRRRAARRADARTARRHPPVTLMWRDDGRPVVAAVDDEIVALGLARDRLADRRLERLVALRLAQRRAQIGGVLLAEAHIERAGAGQPDAVAALAEIMGQRRDEAEPPAGLAHRAHSAPGRRCGSRSRRASSAAAAGRAPATAAGTGRAGSRRRYRPSA